MVELPSPRTANTIPTIFKVGLYFEKTKLGFEMLLPATNSKIPTKIKNILVRVYVILIRCNVHNKEDKCE
jgi:hypothetical protein